MNNTCSSLLWIRSEACGWSVCCSRKLEPGILVPSSPSVPNFLCLLLDLLLSLVGFEPEPVCTSETVPWLQVSICTDCYFLFSCIIWLWVPDGLLLFLFLLCYVTREGDLPLIVAIDLQPMAPIEGVIQVQGDITNARTAEVVSSMESIDFSFPWAYLMRLLQT